MLPYKEFIEALAESLPGPQLAHFLNNKEHDPHADTIGRTAKFDVWKKEMEKDLVQALLDG